MTKTYVPKSPKEQKEFKSDRSWHGKAILGAESADKSAQHGAPSYPPDWKTAESYVDSKGYVNCFVDDKLVARYPTAETRTRERKDSSNNE